MEPFIWNYLVVNNEDGDNDNDDNDSNDDDDENNNVKDGDVACLSSRSAKTARRWLARQRTSLAVVMSVWISDIYIYHEHLEEKMTLIKRTHLLKDLCVV